ncbi:MAG TPA: anti-sigma factor [Casimicrobiaceae bacterium]|jgi:anti-sigma factor RsiW|nr:anti-sigma factor [Casimicrobiaceae bacterium]
MNCNEAGMLVGRYADGEIDSIQGRSIERHLRECAACSAKHQEVLALRARIGAEVPYFTATPALRERVRAMLANAQDTAPARPRTQRDRWGWLTGGFVAGCAAAMLAWSVGTTVVAWRANEDIAVDAVATHVRATLNNHLIQVASSDQHTVKPWLSARLDYSPPVQDLASEGFPLTGGRLDMLNKQRVATLVYTHRLHTIDVFVRPESAPAPSTLRNVRGFNVAHATGSGMDWIAVSDVNADELTQFVQRLAQQTPTP